MKMRNSVLAASLVAVIAATTAAWAAGLWPNLPIVGSAAFCSTTNTAGVPGTASVCTTTTPAGPTIVTGLETVPADTHRARGANPQTVNLTLASLNALPVTFTNLDATTGANSITATAVTGGIIISSSAVGISPTSIWLPASPIDGQQFVISSATDIGTLNVLTVGTDTVANSPTTLLSSTTGSYGYQFKYRSSDGTWFRMR